MAHYFFYAMSVFTITVAINFWDSFLVESITLLFFSLFYINASLWLAYFFYKDYEKDILGFSALKNYALRYMGLSIYVVFMTVLLIYMVPGFGELIYSILFINYYYAFAIVIGVLLLVFKPVRILFRFPGGDVIYKAKKIAVKYSRMSELESYAPKTDPIIDSMLEEVWSHKDNPVDYVKNIESYMCESKIREIESNLKFAKLQGKAPHIIEGIQKKKDRYQELLDEIKGYKK